MLFFFPQYTLSYDKLEYYLYCNQIPEGNPFGLIFKDNEVAQIGIENFEKIVNKPKEAIDFGRWKRALKGGVGSGRGAWSNPSFGRIFEEGLTCFLS